MYQLIFLLLMAGVISGLVQYFVDFLGLKTDEPPTPSPQSFAPENSPGVAKIIYLFLKEHWHLVGHLVVGIAGALMVPVIHNIIKLESIDDYIRCMTKGNTVECAGQGWNKVVIIGYGIIAGYSSVRIIRGFGSLILNSIEQRVKKNQEALNKANHEIEVLKTRVNQPPLPPPTVLHQESVMQGFYGLQNGQTGTRAQIQVYFDQPKNEREKKGYYAGIDFENRYNLYYELNKLITVTHKSTLGYNPSRHLYPCVDRYEDGKLRSIYSGEAFTVQQLLEMDAEVDRMRLQAVASITNMGFSADEAISRLEALEDQLPYNCEHVVPQSWFGKKEPMRGDLHHLFTCESRCNSFRNNHRYHDFPDYGLREGERDACGKLNADFFEPENNKGVVARAVLYFLLRYPSAFINEMGYTAHDVTMLLNWHNEQPVTLYELHRNQEIFRLQGNRNPFIDFPATEISFPIDANVAGENIH